VPKRSDAPGRPRSRHSSRRFIVIAAHRLPSPYASKTAARVRICLARVPSVIDNPGYGDVLDVMAEIWRNWDRADDVLPSGGPARKSITMGGTT
jgi:hypothetical protein